MWAFASGILASTAAIGDDGMARAQELMKAGRPGEAYAILEKLEFDKAGDTDFDYLLGIAALDSGKPDKATLAFERVLAIKPGFAGARLDMARAYFALGDYPSARRELQIVEQLNPPPAAKAVVEKYLAAIQEKEEAKRTIVTGYLEGAVGRDDNITSVVGDFTGAVLSTYNLPGFQPTGSAIKRASNVFAVAGGAQVSHQITDDVALYAGADERNRHVASAPNYTSRQFDGRAGIGYTQGADSYRGGLSYQDYRQVTDTPGTTANRNSIGVNVEWRRALGANDQASLFGLYAQQRFQDVPTNNIDSYTLGGSWLHVFEGDVKPVLYGSLFVGQDDAKNKLANGADVAKTSVGARFFGQVSPRDDIDVFAGVGYLERNDQSQYARATTVQYGKDRSFDLSLGLNWRPAKDWTVRPQLVYSENRSNVALSEYKRTEASLTVRYDFN